VETFRAAYERYRISRQMEKSLLGISSRQIGWRLKPNKNERQTACRRSHQARAFLFAPCDVT
jgi:hypothetical protein